MLELTSPVFVTEECHQGLLRWVPPNPHVIKPVVVIFGASVAVVVWQYSGGHQDVSNPLVGSVHTEGHAQLNECRGPGCLLAQNAARCRATVAQRPHVA